MRLITMYGPCVRIDETDLFDPINLTEKVNNGWLTQQFPANHSIATTTGSFFHP
jgi:hypothetical protein